MTFCAFLLLLQAGPGFVCSPPAWAKGDEPEDLLWPIGDGFTPPKIHQTYLQAEVSGSVHAHAGLDLVPPPSRNLPYLPSWLQPGREVFALEDGTVVRIELDLEGGGKRAGLVVAARAPEKHGRAFLYMHLDPSSIYHIVGDEVDVDEYLGRVRAEDADTDHEEHLHLARVAGPYADPALPWSEVENLSIRNPLVLIDHGLHDDSEAPVITIAESALFRRNEVHNDFALIPANAVPEATMLDVLARVQDFSASSGPLAPYKLEVVIGTESRKEKFGLLLDGPPPRTSDVFYDEKHCTPGACSFVLTNGNLATNSFDKLHAWCASPGKHTLEILAHDAAGNGPSSFTLAFTVP